MGPVNWIAVLVATAVAAGLGYVFYLPLRGGSQGLLARLTSYASAAGLFFLPAAMLGHMFARTGVETLAVKPWLYFMMSGGAALTLVIPVLCFTYSRRGLAGPKAASDGLFAFIAFLAMGTVFWAMG